MRRQVQAMNMMEEDLSKMQLRNVVFISTKPRKKCQERRHIAVTIYSLVVKVEQMCEKT